MFFIWAVVDGRKRRKTVGNYSGSLKRSPLLAPNRSGRLPTGGKPWAERTLEDLLTVDGAGKTQAFVVVESDTRVLYAGVALGPRNS